jgi:ligand-binding sensor domain-containing protein
VLGASWRRSLLLRRREPKARKRRYRIVVTSATDTPSGRWFIRLTGGPLGIRQIVALLALADLLLVGCTTARQDTSLTASHTPPTTGTGSGLWPAGSPAAPSPTATPIPGSTNPTTPDPKAGMPDTSVTTMPFTNTVATSINAGWTKYESINNIHDSAFARDGTLWAATSGGLVHWNLNTQTYTRYPIRATAMDMAPDGSLWLVLEQGVCRFDGASCQIYSEADGLMGNDIHTIVIAPDGIVWVGTGQGVRRFDGDSWQSYPSPVATYDLAVTAHGEVWAATAGGVRRYFPAEDRWITYTEDHGLSSSNAQVIATGLDGAVWVYLAWEGVYRFDGAGWQKVEGASEPILDMAFAADGTPWVATAGGMHYPGGTLSYHDGSQWNDVASNQVLHSFTSIAVGADGPVAVSTQLGLGLYKAGEWRLLRDGLTSERVTSVAVTPDGAVWFAFGDHSVSTPGWGLSRFDGQAWDYYLDDAEVNVLTVGPDGTLWAGVGCGVQRFDGAAWEIVASYEELPAGNILDIDFGPDGTVWVANGLGLARFDGQSWTVYERLVHALEVAPHGTIWVNGWEGRQGSSYVARFDASVAFGTDIKAWSTFKSADSFPGEFTMHAVTPDGLLWGTTPEGGLVSFDGLSWTAGESWTFYDPPGTPFVANVAILTVAPDSALWLASGSSVVRFDRESGSEEAWTIYTQDDGLPESYYQAVAFGPDGEIWFGATRFQPAQTDPNAGRSRTTPRIVETSVPIATVKPSGLPTPYCRPGEAFVDLSVPTTRLEAGQFLTVTVSLLNGDRSKARLGQIRYSLSVHPEMLVLGRPEPVQHSTSIEPGDCDQAQFVLRGVAPGRLVITASASYEMHALDYSWGSWSGCRSLSVEITIVP